MAKTIYKLYMLKSTEAWYQLSSEEQASIMQKSQEHMEKAGGKAIVLSDCSWSSEEYLIFGVEEYPDIEAEQKHAKFMSDMGWFRYSDSKVILGTKWELN